MKKSLREYQAAIRKAASKEELTAISYDALKNDPECTVFSKKYEKIIDMCIERESQLIPTQPDSQLKPPLSDRITSAEKQPKNNQAAPTPQTRETGR